MADRDVGGAITELVITCVTRRDGPVEIVKGMALIQTEEDYGVTRWNKYCDRLFGQALASCNMNEKAIPVKVRGICVLAYPKEDHRLEIGGRVMMSPKYGLVCGANAGSLTGTGIVLKVDTAAQEVHVLL